MAVGRLYYTIAALFLCTLYCHSHYEAKYPERGFVPWSGWRNKWRRAREEKEAAEAEAERRREGAREAESEGRRLAREVAGEGQIEEGLLIREGLQGEEGVGMGMEGEEGVQGVTAGGKGKGKEQDRGIKRRRSDLSSDGDEDPPPLTGEDEAASSDTLSPAPGPGPGLGRLHQRRAEASPEKFDRGLFDLMPLKVGGGKERGPPAKKVRTERKLEVGYDETGTPRVASFPPEISEPIHEMQNETPSLTAQAKGSASIAAAGTAASRSSSLSTRSTSTLDSTVHTSILLNSPSAPTSSYSTHPQHHPHHPRHRQQKKQKAKEKKADFSLLRALLNDNDLLLQLISYLPLPALISLYSISKPFHYLFNRHPTAFILSSTRTWAPNADTIFPWRCYQSLCVKDPAKRQKKRLEGREEEVRRVWDDLRDVPSLRWLQMVVWREGVSKDCLIQLAVQGLRCPPGTLDAVKRMWFLLDLPLNAHRIALIRTTTYLSTAALHNLTCFFLKLDMRFTDPVRAPYPINHPNQLRHPNKFAGGCPTGVKLRKMLLAERQLTPLWRVLRGWNWDPREPRVPLTRLDVLRLWVRHRYRHPDGASEEVRKQSVMGIPWWEVGTAGYERTGVAFLSRSSSSSNNNNDDEAAEGMKGEKQIPILHPAIIPTTGLTSHQQNQLRHKQQETFFYPHRKSLVLPAFLSNPKTQHKPREPLLRPDELVLKESVRRGLGMHRKWVFMMLFGISDDAGVDFPVWTEEELLRLGRGLPARKPDEEVIRKEGEDGEEASGKGLWTKLPARQMK